MGKNKLQKFADIETYKHVFQYPFGALQSKGFEGKGQWSEFFGNDHPIVLELGCGKGEYTVQLAKLFPEKNFIGIDIKGARIWTGAKQVQDEQIKNAAFIRTDIELINHFFAAGEVSEIWITFPDPQMKKLRKRLTSTRFMEFYRQILKEDGIIHLKCDSNFLFTYTKAMVELNKLPILTCTEDLYTTELGKNPILAIKTHYEQQWLERGLKIRYLQFQCIEKEQWLEPDIEIEFDSYRSYNRSRRSGNKSTDQVNETEE